MKTSENHRVKENERLPRTLVEELFMLKICLLFQKERQTDICILIQVFFFFNFKYPIIILKFLNYFIPS